MSVAVGIDLGTTNTVVGAVRDGLAFTIADQNGRRLIPSTVSFHPSGKVLVGHPAIERRLNDPENTVYSVKRLIGRSWDSEEVQATRARFPFHMKEGPKKGIIISARGEEYTLPEISAFVLRYAKATAEAMLGEPVDRAVITVPANFNDLQRAATKVAGKLAGLEVLRILNEPTAAALAYGQGSGVASNDLSGANTLPVEKLMSGERVAVYDLGGGTFDITLLDLSGNVFEVLATAGDTSLGGDDFDNLIAEKMADDLLRKHRFDARANPQAFGQLRAYAEQMKRELSAKDEHTMEMNDVAAGEGGRMLPFSFRMTRTELEWASLPLVDRTFAVCQSALDRASMDVDKVDRIILVGGSTRMPVVARKVEQFFKKAPVMRVNPDEVVALGAAIQASALDRGARRKATAPKPAQPATIAQESLLTAQQEQQARRPPSMAAPPDEESVPMLPLVNAPWQQPGSVGAMAVAPPAPPPPAAKPPEAPIVGNAIFAIGDDLESALPAPDAPPVQAGRPLVFDLPPEPQKAPPPPPVVSKTRTAPGLDAPSLPAAPRAQPAPAPPPPAVPKRAPLELSQPAIKPPLLIDVTPLSLNVETVGGFCDTLIEGNTPVPCDRTRVFLTASDNQTAVIVRVAQGPSNKFAENTFLGELELSGLMPARRGEVEIAVTFEIDADGILNVKAKDQKSGRETKARMHLLGQQTEAHEIAAMQARQARHAIG